MTDGVPGEVAPALGRPAPSPARLSRAWLALAGLALLVAVALPVLQPDALVTAYLVHVFPRLVAVLGPIDRALPVPGTDLLELAALALFLRTLGRHAFRVSKKRETARAAVGKLASGLVGFLAVVYLVGVLAGLYVVGRRPIEARLGLDPRTVTAEQLLEAALRLNEPLIEARRALGKVPRLTTTRAGDWLAQGSTPDFPVDPGVVQEAARAAARDALRTLEGREWDTFQSPRAPVPDTLLHHYGVAGRTNPLLGEVCVSPYLSAVEYPVILAHEYSHTTGVIREREADFHAFVGGWRSRCPLQRFSTLVIMRSRLTEAAKSLGIADAWDQARAPVPADILDELDVLAALYEARAFAPGGVIELKEGPSGEPEIAAVTTGDAPGTAPVAAYRAVTATAGLPPDYDSCLPLVALWVLRH